MAHEELDSQISGFYKLDPDQRLRKVAEMTGLSADDTHALCRTGELGISAADKMIENVIGTFELPMGVATNFRIDGVDYLVPMATEEPSVIAAASNGAKAARGMGGFTTEATDPVMIGQIQLIEVEEPDKAAMKILEARDELIELANSCDPVLLKFGGGCKDLEVRVLNTERGYTVVTHILVDCRDAMGANAVNTMAETLAPKIEEIGGGRVVLRILSNLAVHRLVRAKAVFTPESLDKGDIKGVDVIEGILTAYALAAVDPFRATTHNKGIMNGISAVVRATGNDTRAVEAGAHAYAAMEGCYSSLTHYEKDEDGNLVGSIEVPMAVGLIGGATAVHPSAKAAVKILGVSSATELGRIIAAVGLAQNFSALRALASTGIQKGHMKLHARNMAVMAGATDDIVDEVVKRLIAGGKVRMDVAEEIVKELKG